MTNEEKLEQVLQWVTEGLGRRKIARALETTEWEARQLMAAVMAPDAQLSPTKAGVKKEKRSTGRSTVLPKKETRGRPTVRVVSNVQGADTPSKMKTRPTSLKVAVLSDVHYPYEDANAIKLAKAYLVDWQPDMIVLNGDISDCYSVSRYQKDMKGRPDIQEELDYTHDRLEEWTLEFPDTEFKFLEGNHEARMKKHIDGNAPALAALRGLAYPELVRLGDLGIEWIPYDQDMHIGNLLFMHGHYVRKHAGTTARAHFEMYGCSVIVGHVHRLSVGYKRNKQGNHAMIENGTLCDLDVEYARFPDWQHGFTTLEFDGDDFTVYQHPIINYKLIADGKTYVL